MSAFTVVEISGVDWLRKFKMIVLFSVNMNVALLYLHCFYRVCLLSGEIYCRNARKIFHFVGFGLVFFFLDK